MRKLLSLSFVISALFFLVSCDKDESLDLSKIDARILPTISANQQSIFIGEQVEFKCETLSGTDFFWTFEGGTPETSTERNPVVTYNQKGSFSVTLEVSNSEISTESIKNGYISVMDDDNWDEFVFPRIYFTNETLNGNGALYAELIPNEQEFIKRVCYRVCRELFRSPDEMNVLNAITYTIKDDDVLSAKGGNPPHISIHFSSSYLKQRKDEGMSDADLIREIEGVLVHEITHGYQYEPLGAGAYQGGTDFFGFIEGIADFVRYIEGFDTTARRRAGGHWNDGYTTSSFFIDWLHSKDPKFAYKFNQSATKFNPWSWDEATKLILDTPVQELWDEYQSDIATGKITEIDEQLRQMRENRDNGDGDFDEYFAGDDSAIDITDKGCDISNDPTYDSPGNEGVGNLVDNDLQTKFLTFGNTTWVQLDFAMVSVLESYTLTSGNDAPGRDPKNWKLLGSNDGTTWVELDSRNDEAFSDRVEAREFNFTNTEAFRSYKFEFENTDGGGIFQLTELELWGKVDESAPSKVDITKTSPIVTTGDTDYLEGGEPDKAFDGDPGTAFFHMTNEAWLAFETTEKYNITEVSLSAMQDWWGLEYVFSCDKWTLLGSNDGETWTEISSVDDTGIVNFEQTKFFTFENSEYFKYHKIELFAEFEEKGRLVVGEMKLLGTAE